MTTGAATGADQPNTFWDDLQGYTGRGTPMAIPFKKTLGGIPMVGALVNDGGLPIMSWDTQGNMYLLKKNTSQNPTNADLLFADFFSLLPVAGQNILATDNNLIAYSHFLPLGSDIPGSVQPVLAVTAAAGTSATIAYTGGVYSGDASGSITIHSGSASLATGEVATITYASPYNPNNPIAFVQQFGSTALGLYVSHSNTTSLGIGVTTAMAPSTNYFIYYQTLGV